MKVLKCPECGFSNATGEFLYGETIYKYGSLIVDQETGCINYEESPEEPRAFYILICPNCEEVLEQPFEQYIVDQTVEEKNDYR